MGVVFVDVLLRDLVLILVLVIVLLVFIFRIEASSKSSSEFVIEVVVEVVILAILIVAFIFVVILPLGRVLFFVVYVADKGLTKQRRPAAQKGFVGMRSPARIFLPHQTASA